MEEGPEKVRHVNLPVDGVNTEPEVKDVELKMPHLKVARAPSLI